MHNQGDTPSPHISRAAPGPAYLFAFDGKTGRAEPQVDHSAMHGGRVAPLMCELPATARQ